MPVGQYLFHVDFSEFLPASTMAREGGVGPSNQFSSNCFSHDMGKLIGSSSDLNSDFLPLGLTYCSWWSVLYYLHLSCVNVWTLLVEYSSSASSKGWIFSQERSIIGLNDHSEVSARIIIIFSPVPNEDKCNFNFTIVPQV